MKHILLAVSLLSAVALPASAGSIEQVDSMVTGPIGSSRSIIVLGATPKAAPVAQPTDAIETASLDKKVINVVFARKYPDPAVLTPTPAASDDGGEGGGMFGGGGSEASAGSGGGGATPASGEAAGVPVAPQDAGTIPEQPPVEQASNGTDGGAGTDPLLVPRGSIDPDAINGKPIDHGK
jgi:hypothetical protein